MSHLNGSPRTAVVAIVALATVSLVAYNLGNALGEAAAASTAPVRGYYLTKNTITGSKVLSACASGYHFASVWEIFNTSDLHYNTTLGRTNANSGNGAPANGAKDSSSWGWIRTGAINDPNCVNWSSSSGLDNGSAAALFAGEPSGWGIDNGNSGTAFSCDATISGTPAPVGVWCVQN